VKFHGTYLQDDRDVRGERARKKLEKAFSFMLRVRIPGGVLTPAQWLGMDRIADAYANHTIRLTTRQAIQFHGVIKSNLKRTMQAINASLLDTLAACGDVNRNVMCNPFLSKAHARRSNFARLSEHLTREPAPITRSGSTARRSRTTAARRSPPTKSRSTDGPTCRASSRR
jgi:sulfite reductase (NADPH) hemoprotein beta-component